MTPNGDKPDPKPGPGQQLTVAAPKPPIATGAQVSALIPRTLDEMFRIAEAMAISRLAPDSLKSREAIFVAIMAGAELGLPPFQSVQSFAVVNNRPTLWGDAIPALLWRDGFKIEERFEGEALKDETRAICKITRPDGTEIERSFSVADAKLAKLWGKTGPWSTHPKRMMQVRARAFAARDGAADVLRGLQIREEVEDYARHEAPPSSGFRDRLEASSAGDVGFNHQFVVTELADPETGEVVEGEFTPAETAEPEAPEAQGKSVPPPEDPGSPAPEFALADKVKAYADRLRAASTTVKLQSIRAANRKLLDAVAAEDQGCAQEMDDLFNARWAQIEADKQAAE